MVDADNVFTRRRVVRCTHGATLEGSRDYFDCARIDDGLPARSKGGWEPAIMAFAIFG